MIRRSVSRTGVAFAALLCAGLGVHAVFGDAALVSAQPEAPQPLRRFVGGVIDQDRILEQIAGAYPRTLRQVGTSSVTLRVELGVLRVAYKPRTDAHPRGYLAEIAAYRVARSLEMDNVPPVLGLQMPRRVMQAHFESEHEGEWEPIREEIRWDAPGVARGAAIYWIPAMRSSPLATEAGVGEVAAWLEVDGDVPAESNDVARDLSTLFAFDYLIGNWDRLSGGNVSTTEEGDRLFVRDHNVAFHAPLTGARYARIRRNLERVQRFSRSFIERVEALDEAALVASLEADPEAAERPILNEAQIAGVMSRRRGLLSYVGALVALHGADRVLFWP